MSLELRNPHAVLAAIQSRPVDVAELRMHAAQPSRAWQQAVEAAHTQGISVVQGASKPRQGRRGARGNAQTERTGAGYALIRPRLACELSTLFSDLPETTATTATTAENGPQLWLALDRLQDPHNVGAIFRSAAFFGVRGIVMTKDRSAPLNATVYDTAAGGIEYVPFAVVPNLSRAIELAKRSGLWLLGTSEHAAQDISQVDRLRSWMVVVGNEETGMARLTEKLCDEVCRLTPLGNVTSLNASVAVGSMLAVLSQPPSLK